MTVLSRKVKGTFSLFATTSVRKNNVGTLGGSKVFITNAATGVHDTLLSVQLGGCNLITIKTQSVSRNTSRLTASFGKQIRGITSANLTITQRNGKTFIQGLINGKRIVPFTCSSSCSCGFRSTVKFQNGTTLHVRIDKQLELALNQLLLKLAREIRRSTPHRGAPNSICRAACQAAALACRAACLPFFLPPCLRLCEAALDACLAAC